MAKKRYSSSYKEKLYYDNTVFRGIIATTDANSEGYFKQLINFDVSDTGQSLQPRTGMVSTHLKCDGDYVKLNPDYTAYFRSQTSEYIYFVDFSDFDADDTNLGIKVYKSTLLLGQDNCFTGLEITDLVLDRDDAETKYYLKDYLPILTSDTITSIKPIQSHKAEFAKDDVFVNRNIFKVELTSDQEEKFYLWLELCPNDTDDSLLITVVDTLDQPSVSVDQRNIASKRSIIPDPIYNIYETESDVPAGTLASSFPFIYAQDKSSEKYQIQYVKDSDSALIKPSFTLLPPKDGNKWVYTYTIYSTNPNIEAPEVFDSEIFNLDGTVSTNFDYYKLLKYGITVDQEISYDSKNLALEVKQDETVQDLYEEINTSIDDNSNVLSNFDFIIICVPDHRSGYRYGTTDGYKQVLGHKIDAPYTLSNSKYSTSFTEFLTTLFEAKDDSLGRYKIPIADSKNYTRSYILNYKYVHKDLLDVNNSFLNDLDYYIVPINEIDSTYKTFANHEHLKCKDLILTSSVLVVDENRSSFKRYNHRQLIEFLTSAENINKRYLYRFLCNALKLELNDTDLEHLSSIESKDFELECMFPNVYEKYNSNYDKEVYVLNEGYVKARVYNIYHCYDFRTATRTSSSTLDITTLFYQNVQVFYPKQLIVDNSRVAGDYNYFEYRIFDSVPKTNLFDEDFIFDMSDTDSALLNTLKLKGYFNSGVNIAMYFIQVSEDYTTVYPNTYSRLQLINSTTIKSNIIYSIDSLLSTKPEYQIKDIDGYYDDIHNDNSKWCIFNSTEGYRLVVYNNNTVYMSEANTYNYFTETNRKVYSEKVVKVLPYKDTLLVFTTQNMYSIFPYENTRQVENGYNDDGTVKYIQEKYIIYNILPVLYNIMADERFADVIQIYNNLILFYSTDGQIYLITPSVTIDSDTVFSVKYLNKSANDILANYDYYINNRLEVYNKLPVDRDDIRITSSLTLSHIKINYSIAKYNYTYTLIYDITNNRYTVYDSDTFGYIYNTLFVQDNDVLITKMFNDDLGIVTGINKVSDMDNNYDLVFTSLNSFDVHDIHSELETGVIALDNQWSKRFKTLQTVYKNLTAKSLKLDLNLYIDDVKVNTSLSNDLELTNINGFYAPEIVHNSAELLENNTVLFDFSSFASNKIITHYTNIISIGKQINLQLRFTSKGKYKIQKFAIVFKEHSV